jgi:hypothetical protein
LTQGKSVRGVADPIYDLSVLIGICNTPVAYRICDNRVAEGICDSSFVDVNCDLIKFTKSISIFSLVLFY